MAAKTSSIINQFIENLSEAFGSLSPMVEMRDIEQLAMKVHYTMEFGQRIYHSSPHALEMCRDMNPHQVLAGIFHDIVYYQLDGGFPTHFDAVLRQVVQVNADGLSVRDFDTENHGVRMCAGLFGFRAGDTLPVYGGMNEFLSAVVAMHCLSPYLKPADLLIVLTLIAATIPCWTSDQQGQSPIESLLNRVREVRRELNIDLDDGALEKLAQDVVVFANMDVSGFAVEDPAAFLYATWMLIEESNAPLAFVGVYSVQEFRKALQRMEGFLASLSADRVFHNYRNMLSANQLAHLCSRAKANLEFAVHYLDAKLASIAIIEALALETGGDAPISMLLGDLKSVNPHSNRVENFLLMPPVNDEANLLLLDVLQEGRRLNSGGQLAASPLSAFLYLSVGMDGIAVMVQDAQLMFSGQIGPTEFLKRLPRALLQSIIDGCSRIAISRAEALRSLGMSL